ncbi:DoxX family protein [Xanthobacteraceae bacterium Astr-EGSB]|uniref:DoxX family protein n=1 Tax=Astrobacterium formosum TaxID=3069710 RepID=UPI0027B7DD8A|nr:DoxX family protein [Xanthobacteraceae bacterium Astr-EGSB]
MAGLCYALGRVLVSILFVVSGYLKFMGIGAVAQTLAAKNPPIPVVLETWTGLPRFEVLGYALALIEVLCGIMVMIGFKARFAAAVLALATIGMVLVGLDVSTWQVALRTAVQAPFLQSMATIGGLLLVAAAGAGPWSFDRRSQA